MNFIDQFWSGDLIFTLKTIVLIIDELKCNIQAEIAAITPEMLANVMQNARKRAAFCVSNGGGHLIYVVF